MGYSAGNHPKNKMALQYIWLGFTLNQPGVYIYIYISVCVCPNPQRDSENVIFTPIPGLGFTMFY